MRSNISELKQLLRRVQQPVQGHGQVSSGCGPLDELLPDRGFARGSLVEWLSEASGSGASLLALAAARQACRDGGVLVVVDRERTFYPPAAAAWIDLQSTIVVRPRNEKDEHWALDQALRCPHVAAVLAWPQRLDNRTFRRLQLAAETSGCLGLLVRGARARTEPSWSDVRLLVSASRLTACPTGCAGGEKTVAPAQPVGHAVKRGQDGLAIRSTGWRLRVEVLRCRGGLEKRELELEIDDQTGEFHETHTRHLAAELAHTAADLHQVRA